MAEERVVLRRRHSAQLRALVLEQCAEPRASVAKVAMSHGLNANMVHGWRKHARELDVAGVQPAPSLVAVAVDAAPHTAQFVAVSLTPTQPPLAVADIQIAVRRGATAMTITWPIAAAADCAAWMRVLLVEPRR